MGDVGITGLWIVLAKQENRQVDLDLVTKMCNSSVFLGIKIGRYTTEKRRQDTVEVKQLKAESAMLSQKEQEQQKQKQMDDLTQVIVTAGRKHFNNLDTLHAELAEMQEEINVSCAWGIWHDIIP